MKYFSVPSDFKNETIDIYYEMNNSYPDSKVYDTYGQITSGIVQSSGRATEFVPQVDLKQLESYIAYSRNKGISFNYTLNPSCLGNFEFSEEGIGKTKTFINNLIGVGVEIFTVTLPSLVEIIRSVGHNVKIKASTICEISTPDKALFYKKMGAYKIVLDPDITRNFRAIKDICDAFGEGVEIIVNNFCHKNCAYKMFHYNWESHFTPSNTSQTIKDYYYKRCRLQRFSDIKNIIKTNWIRPEDLKYYIESGINHFKLQGRPFVHTGNCPKAVKCYFDESHPGNLLDLVNIFSPLAFNFELDNTKLDGFVKKFYDYPDFCRSRCDKCRYCDEFVDKCFDRGAVEKFYADITKSTIENDVFMNMLK